MKHENMKIAIIGYGTMGKQIEKAAIDNNHSIAYKFDIDNKIIPTENYYFDVAIDFSYPDSVYKNVETICKLKRNLVIGTTGWEKDFDKIKLLAEQNEIGIVYGSNYSIGMQIFSRVVELASRLINHQLEYDIFLHEIHHKNKKDSPSGTALSLAKIIINNVASKKEILTDKSANLIPSNSLHVTSTRGGDFAGTHTVFIDSYSDTIELTHRAKNRSGFALGAILAAEWIKGKKGFFKFDDVIGDIWQL